MSKITAIVAGLLALICVGVAAAAAPTYTTSSTQTTITLSGLKCGTNYRVRLQSYNADGTLSQTTAKSQATQPCTTTQFALSVSKAGTGSGTVTSSPAGINCGATCSANYNSGTSVTLTATAASGSTFAGFSGACTGSTCTVSMTQNRAVTATFNTTPPPPPAQCADGLDNDGDGLTDYPNDPGCTSTTDNDETNSPPPPSPACSDGVDNDNDGKIDFPNDPGCVDALDTDETDPTPPPAGEPVPIAGLGYHQAFRDDFNGTTLDSSSWNPKQFWESDPPAGAVVVSNGTVKINNNRTCCDDQSITTGPYWGGEPTKKSWQYGYFEARMKFTDAQGSWPAFWLESVSHAAWNGNCPHPNGGNFELDIMEYQGDEPNTFYGTEHSNTNSYCGVGDSTRPNLYPQPKKLAGDWHLFAIEWNASTITWYVDNVKMFSANTFASGNQQMFIALTMQACGWDSTNSCTSATPNPLTTEVDYVTVWQK